MHKGLSQFNEYKRHRKLISFFFVLGILFLSLAFLAVAILAGHSQLFVIIFICLSIISLIHTVIFYQMNIIIINELEAEFHNMNLEICSSNEAKAKPKSDESIDSSEDSLTKTSKNNSKTLSEGTIKTEKTNYETNGEVNLNLNDIDTNKYSSIVIYEKEITVVGQLIELSELSLTIPDQHNCIITLDNIILRGGEHPAINIGKNCTVVLKLVGDNQIVNNGIRVPETAELTLLGEGNLTIMADRTNRIGIGGTDSQSYGNITIATMSNININCRANISIGIGGGQNTEKSVIKLLSGNITVSTSGYHTLGIGSLLGNAIVLIDHCNLKLKGDGTKSVGIGSLHGFVHITSSGNVDIRCSGNRSIAIGSLEEGCGNIFINSGIMHINFVTNQGCGIGTENGCLDIELLNGELLINGEGSYIIGIGDHIGKSKIKIRNGLLSIQLFSTNSLLTGTLPQKIIIDGGNIQCDFPETIIPVNSFGTPLESHLITDTYDYSQVIETISYRYVYKATYSDQFPYIKVYLPENYSIYNYQIK